MTKGPESILLSLATLTIQGSALSWSHDHRLHHRFTDREGDPYNVKKGLLHAHVLWLFEKRPPLDQTIVPDLMKNKLLVFQDRHFTLLATIGNILVVIMTGWLIGDLIGALAMAFGVRLLLTYHITWFINSLAHYWGEQSYSKECSARNNAILAFLTHGEGYHSYHHAFPTDYRNGYRWWQFDPNKWFIWLMSRIGLTKDLKKHEHTIIRNRLIKLDYQQLLEMLKELDSAKIQAALQKHGLEAKQGIEDLIDSLYQSLRNQGREIAQAIREYRATPRKNKVARKNLRDQVKQLRQSYKVDWKRWSALCTLVMT